MPAEDREYQPHIDGLRAIAVLGVLFFHAKLGVPGGFVGVDVFFVISGYLITRLILNTLDAGTFTLAAFWERRIRRLFPAMAVVALACLVAGWFIFTPANFVQMGRSLFAQAFLGANFYFWKASGYFEQSAQFKPFLHTWSLAVEEQFYLILPLLILALRRFPRFMLVTAICLLGIASLGLSVYCTYRYPEFSFYLLPTRAWELCLGSLVAVVPAGLPAKQRPPESISLVGLAAILIPFFLFDRNTPFPGIAAILPCAGTALVLWANSLHPTRSAKLLSKRPLTFVGKISYSLYLWHWPVLVFSSVWWTLGLTSWTVRALLLIASAGFATLSWKYVEAPFRNRSLLPARSSMLLFAGSVTALLLFVANLGIDRRIASLKPSMASVQALRAEADLAYLSKLGEQVRLKEALAGNFIELGKSETAAPVDFLVWGDSHAAATTRILGPLCNEYGLRGVAAVHNGTPPLTGFYSANLDDDSLPFNAAVADFVRKHNVSNVILIAKWSNYVNKDGTAQVHSALVDTIRAIKSPATKIWIVKQVPSPPTDVPQALHSIQARKQDPSELDLPLEEHKKESLRLDPVFKGLEEAFDNVRILDPTGFLVDQGRQTCRMSIGGRALYCDHSHLSAVGATLLRPLFEPILEGLPKSKATTNGRVEDGHGK